MTDKKLPLRAAPRRVASRAIGKVKDVNVQDQTTPSVILPLAQQLGLSTLFSEAVPELYQIVVTDPTGMSIGDHIRIINAAADRYYRGTVLGISGLTIDLDTPVDFPYTAGSEVTWSNINMAIIDGSVTPVHFHLRTGAPSIPSSVDITRILMVCECEGEVDLNKFGDIAGGLTRGLVFREQNGVIRNIFNVKSNRGLVALAYDWTPFAASHPNQGINGFAWRLTFASQGKMGVAIRVSQEGQLGMIVQDDLTSLVTLSCIVEGHVVLD